MRASLITLGSLRSSRSTRFTTLPTLFDILTLPMVTQRFTCERLTLSRLILVVWENEVLPPTVDMNRVPQVLFNHCAAFYVPSRPTLTPRARPSYLTRSNRLPQREVFWVAFFL